MGKVMKTVVLGTLLVIFGPASGAFCGDSVSSEAAARGGDERAAYSLSFDAGSALGGGMLQRVAIALSGEIGFETWSLALQPSFYYVSGSDDSVLQLGAKTGGRVYPLERFFGFEGDRGRSGPFAGGGLYAAYMAVSGDTEASACSIGPYVELGYKLPVFIPGLYIEPYAGWMALFGYLDGNSVDTPKGVVPTGFYGGLSLGYRFGE